MTKLFTNRQTSASIPAFAFFEEGVFFFADANTSFLLLSRVVCFLLLLFSSFSSRFSSCSSSSCSSLGAVSVDEDDSDLFFFFLYLCACSFFVDTSAMEYCFLFVDTSAMEYFFFLIFCLAYF